MNFLGDLYQKAIDYAFVLPGTRLPNEKEIQTCEDLQALITTPYSEETHEVLLKEMWRLAQSKMNLKGDYERESKGWRFMGFQREDPTCDIRGGGECCLKALLYYIANEEASRLKEYRDRDYPFAAAGININRMVLQILGVEKEPGTITKTPSANNNNNGRGTSINEDFHLQKKNYLFLLNSMSTYLNFYCFAFRLFNQIWVEENGHYLDFNRILDVTKTRLIQICQKEHFKLSAFTVVHSVEEDPTFEEDSYKTPERKANRSVLLENGKTGMNISRNHRDPNKILLSALSAESCSNDSSDSRKVEEVNAPNSNGNKSKQFAVTLNNVLSPEECQQWITFTESLAYDTAAVNIGGGVERVVNDYRNSERCIVDDLSAANILFSRIKHALPEIWNDSGVEWYLVGLNERLRFLKYQEGQFFKSHYDGTYIRGDNLGPDRAFEQSMITFQLYLSDMNDEAGGATRFFSDTSNACVKVQPKSGKVLLFEHRMLHDGEELRGGIKYALRTDVMYTTKAPGRYYNDQDIENFDNNKK